MDTRPKNEKIHGEKAPMFHITFKNTEGDFVFDTVTAHDLVELTKSIYPFAMSAPLFASESEDGKSMFPIVLNAWLQEM